MFSSFNVFPWRRDKREGTGVRKFRLSTVCSGTFCHDPQLKRGAPQPRDMKMLTFGLIALAIVAVAIALRPRIARADLVKEGQLAPPFSTEMVTGDQQMPISLADFSGRKVILYFYPKDDTPGCTKEACAFRDGYTRFQNAGLTVLGCSIDSADAHKDFIRKYSLPFPLLLDPEKKIAKAYRAANGIPILGLDRRVTYVIGESGTVLKVYPNVDPSTHATAILKDLGVSDATPIPQTTPPPAPN
jgi:peroxiredoxin Q/BCP